MHPVRTALWSGLEKGTAKQLRRRQEGDIATDKLLLPAHVKSSPRFPSVAPVLFPAPTNTSSPSSRNKWLCSSLPPHLSQQTPIHSALLLCSPKEQFIPSGFIRVKTGRGCGEGSSLPGCQASLGEELGLVDQPLLPLQKAPSSKSSKIFSGER